MDYRVKKEGGLFIVHGQIPIVDSECLGACWTFSIENPVYDWQLAEALEASMVVGSERDCNIKRRALGLPLLATISSEKSHEGHAPETSPKAPVTSNE